MSYIGRCQLSGYKSIKNVSCEFNKGLNIIIGNNGSGKTNLLEFINKVLVKEYSGLDIFKAEIDIYEGAGKRKIEWRAEGTINEDKMEEKEVDQQPEGEDVYIEFVKFSLPVEIPILGVEYNPRYSFTKKHFLSNEQTSTIPDFLYLWILLYRNEHLRDIAGESDITDDYIFNSLNDDFEDYFREVKTLLSLYTPIQDVRISNSIRVAKIDSSTFDIRNIVFEYKINNDWLSWNALSDGTKRLIYIFFINNRIDISNKKAEPLLVIDPPILLIEEPEIGIHPHQLHLLLTYLKEKAENQQIIITTHSPQILDVLSVNELDHIFIAEIDYENGTTVRKLTEKETEKAKLYLQDEGMLSDYWRFSDFQSSKES